jgi:acyl-CoA thioesterase FadM
MKLFQSGTPTFYTRVEAWECDLNGHWNTRFYARAFEQAACVCTSFLESGIASKSIIKRHCRFHGELFSGDLVEIRSFILIMEDGMPAIVHALTSDGKLAATSLDIGSKTNSALETLTQKQADLALPRGLTDIETHNTSENFVTQTELGLLHKNDLNPHGTINFETLMARIAIASTHHSACLGFTPTYSKETGINRMLVEMQYKPKNSVSPGDLIRARSSLIALHSKGYITLHSIETHAGVEVANFELLSLTVDRETRRAVAPPAFIPAAIENKNNP